MNEENNGLPGRYSDMPGQINRLVKLEPIPKKQNESAEDPDAEECADAIQNRREER